MSLAERKERQRAERYELILAAARELAEAEGWDAVTTRRLAELIDYSQPVLYSHFKGKADIMAAVATRGFEELATRLKMETANVTGAPDVLRNVCAAYLDFARSRPVVYEAMFVLPTKIKFASEETPTALRAAFAALVTALGPDRQEPTFFGCCGARCMEWSSSCNLNASQLQAPRLDCSSSRNSAAIAET